MYLHLSPISLASLLAMYPDPGFRGIDMRFQPCKKPNSTPGVASKEKYEIWWDGEFKGTTPVAFDTDTSYHHVTIKKDGQIYCGCNESGIDPVLDPYKYDEYVTRFRVGLDEVEGDCVYAFHVTDSSHISLTVDIDKQTCAWVDIHGGKENIKMFDILDILGAYKGDVSIGFTPGMFDVMGVIAYYKGDYTAGDGLLGC